MAFVGHSAVARVELRGGASDARVASAGHHDRMPEHEIQDETGATFLIRHNITSVMRTSDYIAVLYLAGLPKFGSKQEMRTTSDPILRQRGRQHGDPHGLSRRPGPGGCGRGTGWSS